MRPGTSEERLSKAIDSISVATDRLRAELLQLEVATEKLRRTTEEFRAVWTARAEEFRAVWAARAEPQTLERTA